MTLGMDNWAETIEGINSGKKVQVSPDVFDYFLEVLPPIFMGKMVEFKDGTKVLASFGFAEGAEKVKVFWMEGQDYYCRQSDMMNPSW